MKEIPYHIGIIIDGNRRWAKNKSLPFLEGHRRGLEKVKKIGRWCKKKGIKILTLFAFSTENWNRPKIEVSYLMKLIIQALSQKNIKEIDEDGIRIKIIGQKERLSSRLQEIIKKAEATTRNNREGILNIALNYGGKAEIVEAVKKIIKKRVPFHKISEKLIEANLWTSGEPHPDLIIRTGGEERLSNFLIWQTAYSELYFSKKYWPDFTEEDLDEILEDYSHRQRRFGK
ncbi:MAG TPA: di-trans,poly-cis-decaprenylcistransferase [Candidatus Nealsonbacteria bacterium]|uniref:Isoprenyl transferase n=1 Tax=marine sediment metagenome TaxID=412755 RepID=A0A0F9YEC5_9ZZZZ|nr:di-trans,poly-cis-decaprenylcistransferase [Candidatus Nealsonbacteria bacterium]HEB46504.1 di-trans,poly-cis-decaprenylcistransferase [Candidatus Nealsonbacteria bacterium]